MDWMIAAILGWAIGAALTTVAAYASYQKHLIALNSIKAWQMEMLERAREIIEQAKGWDDLGLAENPTALEDWTDDYTKGRLSGR